MQKKVIAFIMGSSFVVFAGCENKAAVTKDDPVERGKYLVTFGVCHDCHTPKIQDPDGNPVPDLTRSFSGHPQELPYPTWTTEDLQKRHAMTLSNEMLTAWAGPWGVSFAANLTPDKETGIGEWTEEAFIQAIRTGKHQGQPNGRAILPPMPWPMFRHMNDDDLKAVWAYLRTLPPIKNQVPLPIPPKSNQVD